METSAIAILSFGFLLGVKHAVEADHIAAVSTIVTDSRSLLSSAIVGGIWGLGHTISLTAVGILVVLLNFQVSESVESKLELAVGVMLFLLGMNVVRNLVRNGRLASADGQHDHVHAQINCLDCESGTDGGDAASNHVQGPARFTAKSLIIGMVHGLAGSAALMLLVIPTIDSALLAVLYIVIFGVGSIAGMMITSFLVGLPLSLSAVRSNSVNAFLRCAAAIFSIAIGMRIIYEHAFVSSI